MMEEQRALLPIINESTPVDSRKWHLWNVVWCGIGFQFIFLGFNTAQNFLPKLLTSSASNVGWWSLTVVYVATVITVFFAPALGHALGWRASFFLSALTFVAFVASFVYPVDGVIYATSALVGVGAGVLWVCNGTWIFQNSTPANRGLHNGVFWSLFQTSGLTGNLVAFGVFEEVDPSKYWVLMTFLAASCLLGALILLFSLRMPPAGTAIVEPASFKERTKAALDVLCTRNCWLMMALFIFTGFDFTFTGSELPFLIDTRMAGAVLAVWGGAEMVGGLTAGPLSDRVGRKFVMVLSSFVFAVGLGLTAVLRSFPAQAYLAYIAAALFGLSDAGLNIIVGSALNDLFPDKQQRGAFVGETGWCCCFLFFC